jgi:hypothetical protein
MNGILPAGGAARSTRIRELHPVTAVDAPPLAALTAEIGPARTATLVADGMVFQFHGRPLVMAPAVEAGAADTVAFFLWIDGWLAPGQPGERLLSGSLDAAGIYRRWLRLTPGQLGHQGRDLRRGAIYLRPPDGAGAATGAATEADPARTDQSGSRFEVRPPQDTAELAFVADLLNTAIRIGCAELGVAGELEVAGPAADRPGLALDGEPLTCRIALADGVPVGHASWIASREDELTGQPYVELVDISVVPEARRRGATAVLAAAAQAAATDRGQPLVGSVVCQADGGHRPILDRLLADGWWIAFGVAAHG